MTKCIIPWYKSDVLRWAKFETKIYLFILQLFIEYFLCSGHYSQHVVHMNKKKPWTENRIKALVLRDKHNSHAYMLTSMYGLRNMWTLWQQSSRAGTGISLLSVRLSLMTHFYKTGIVTIELYIYCTILTFSTDWEVFLYACSQFL